MSLSTSARSFFERHGLYYTERLPTARVDMRSLRIEQLPMDRVPARLARQAEGAPSPDRGAAQTWLPPLPASG